MHLLRPYLPIFRQLSIAALFSGSAFSGDMTETLQPRSQNSDPAVRKPVQEPLVAPRGWIRESPFVALDVSFQQIFNEVILDNGLVLDRRSDRNTVSCAATGFTAYSLALMAERGSDRDEVLELLRRGFRNTLAKNPKRNRGWLYHFTDAEGNAKPWSEVSTIDTAIFYLGFLRAAETLKDDGFLGEIRSSLDKIDRQFVLRDGYFLHGFLWRGTEPRFLESVWHDTSEGVMLYKLFDLPFEPRVVRHDYPLFVYYYPLCFFDLPEYTRLLREAVVYQMNHYGYTGITASDGPYGYQADDPKLISPLTLFALSSVFPEARATLAKYAVDEMVPAYHVGSGWEAPDRVTIDYGSVYILMARRKHGLFENVIDAVGGGRSGRP